jgi:hypothetical protein
MKRYFSEFNDEYCFPIDYFEKGEIVYEAEIERNIDMFNCIEFGVGEKGDCGKTCRKYIPRNGKSGICENNYPVYEKTDKKIIVK